MTKIEGQVASTVSAKGAEDAVVPGGCDDRLAGGVYGVVMGRVFCAESMFYRERDASKVALFHLVEHLREKGFDFLDAQTPSPHILRLGFRNVSRSSFLARLHASVR